jgi:predicted DNA-binding helix-hairpin-helix protein
MRYITGAIAQHTEEKALFKSTPLFAPAGQSTQMVVGASPETDAHILNIADNLYKGYKLKRIYYSGYIPIADDNRLPALSTPPPLIREHRLYQSDWLMRFYGFSVHEIVNDSHPLLDLEIDPKLSWALRNQHLFPVDVNTAPKEMLLRIPGIGDRSVEKMLQARRFGKLNEELLLKLGVVYSRAKYFITIGSNSFEKKYDLESDTIKGRILAEGTSKYKIRQQQQQLKLF